MLAFGCEDSLTPTVTTSINEEDLGASKVVEKHVEVGENVESEHGEAVPAIGTYFIFSENPER